MLFSELIQGCEAALGCFHCTKCIEDAAAVLPTGTSGFKTGRLDVDAIAEECGVTSVYYLSGPPQMITTFRDRLRERGVPAPGIRIDEWE
jgi:ferredoxin-NADP reductase